MSKFSIKKTLAYLGLTEDEYDEGYAYDDYGYEDEQPVRQAPRAVPDEPVRRAPAQPAPEQPYAQQVQPRIRPIATHEQPLGTPRVLQPVPQVPTGSVRPIGNDGANVTVVMPREFGDAKRVADQLKAGKPCIVNLQAAPGDVPRRMIDFCAGTVYAISGSMEKVADQVFLLSPSNVSVSAEERARLERRDYGQD